VKWRTRDGTACLSSLHARHNREGCRWKEAVALDLGLLTVRGVAMSGHIIYPQLGRLIPTGLAALGELKVELPFWHFRVILVHQQALIGST
jgi:hypothetical protein